MPSPPPWTEEQFLRAVAMRRQNRPLREISRETGVSERTLSRRFLDLDLGYKPSFRADRKIVAKTTTPSRIARDRAAEMCRAENHDDERVRRKITKHACNEHLLDLRDYFEDGHGERVIPPSGCSVPTAALNGRRYLRYSPIGSSAAMCVEAGGSTGTRTGNRSAGI